MGTLNAPLQILSSDQIVSIVRSLSGHVDLQAAISAVSRELQGVLPHDHFDAALIAEDGDELIVFETGLKTSWGVAYGKISNSPIRNIFSGNVDHMVTKNAQTDKRFSFVGADVEPVFRFDLRARVHTKIEIAGKLIGALSFSSRESDLYEEQHVVVTKTVAHIIGPYLHALRQSEVAKVADVARAEERAKSDGLRQGARLLTEQLERERRRIGMDLHDQTLAELSRILQNLGEPSLPPARKLSFVKSEINSCIDELRTIIEDAKPTLLELFGLIEAVDAFLEHVVQKTDIKCSVSACDEVTDIIDQMDIEPKMAVYRIIQESVNNSLQHASCSKIGVKFELVQQAFTITIQDNGTGLDLQAPNSYGGLQNIKTRAALIGATVDFRAPQTSTGTIVYISMPTQSIGG